MIQDIAPYQFDNRYTPEPPQPASYLLWYDSGRISLQQTGDTITFPRFSDLPAQAQPNASIYFPSGRIAFTGSTRKHSLSQNLLPCRASTRCAPYSPPLRLRRSGGLSSAQLVQSPSFLRPLRHRLAARYQRTHAALPQLRRHAVSADLPGGDHRCHPR